MVATPQVGSSRSRALGGRADDSQDAALVGRKSHSRCCAGERQSSAHDCSRTGERRALQVPGQPLAAGTIAARIAHRIPGHAICGADWHCAKIICSMRILPGVFCRSTATAPLALNCYESDDPWPLGADQSGLSAFFAPTRNFFTGALSPGIEKQTTVKAFYSAAMLPRDKYKLWIFATVDGQVHLLDGVTDQTAARLGWGSDIAERAQRLRARLAGSGHGQRRRRRRHGQSFRDCGSRTGRCEPARGIQRWHHRALG